MYLQFRMRNCMYLTSVIAFMTRLMAIKSNFAFSNNCYKELLNLINDTLPMNHKMLKYMY
jgi:hypothetical protein